MSSPSAWKDPSEVANLVLACDYCSDAPGLLEACRGVSDLLLAKTADEVRAAFGVECDMSIDERVRARVEHSWHLSPNSPIDERAVMLSSIPDIGSVCPVGGDGELVLEIVVANVVLDRWRAGVVAQCSASLRKSVLEWSECRNRLYADHLRGTCAGEWPTKIAPIPRATDESRACGFGGLSWIDLRVLRNVPCGGEATDTLLALKYPCANTSYPHDDDKMRATRVARFRREGQSERSRILNGARDRPWRLASSDFVWRGGISGDVAGRCRNWEAYIQLGPSDRQLLRVRSGPLPGREKRPHVPIYLVAPTPPASFMFGDITGGLGKPRTPHRRSVPTGGPWEFPCVLSEQAFVPPPAIKTKKILRERLLRSKECHCVGDLTTLTRARATFLVRGLSNDSHAPMRSHQFEKQAFV